MPKRKEYEYRYDTIEPAGTVHGYSTRDAAKRAAEKAWNDWAWECPNGFSFGLKIDGRWVEIDVEVDFEPMFYPAIPDGE